jgi:hypothetical protein
MPTVTRFVVMQVRQAPQQAFMAGVRSTPLFRSGKARVCARSNIAMSVRVGRGALTLPPEDQGPRCRPVPRRARYSRNSLAARLDEKHRISPDP